MNIGYYISQLVQFSGPYSTVRAAKFKCLFQSHAKYHRYNKYLTNLVFSVRTVNHGSSFFPLGFMACVLCAWAINPSGENLVRNLQYGPRTRLVRGIWSKVMAVLTECKEVSKKTTKANIPPCALTKLL